MKLRHEVTITNADNGLIVRIGCKTLVILDKDVDEALADLRALMDGRATREMLREKYVMRDGRAITGIPRKQNVLNDEDDEHAPNTCPDGRGPRY